MAKVPEGSSTDSEGQERLPEGLGEVEEISLEIPSGEVEVTEEFLKLLESENLFGILIGEDGLDETEKSKVRTKDERYEVDF